MQPLQQVILQVIRLQLKNKRDCAFFLFFWFYVLSNAYCPPYHLSVPSYFVTNPNFFPLVFISI